MTAPIVVLMEQGFWFLAFSLPPGHLQGDASVGVGWWHGASRAEPVQARVLLTRSWQPTGTQGDL